MNCSVKIVKLIKIPTIKQALKSFHCSESTESIYMKFEKMKVAELQFLLQKNSIDIKGKNKEELIEYAYNHERQIIDDARLSGNCVTLLKQKISELADKYAFNLNEKVTLRKKEMENDDNSHYLIYRVLGISSLQGKLIDEYQNTGRFLYKYAGSFLEEAAIMCLFFSNGEGGKHLVENIEGTKPKTFEIDFLNNNDAIELKWRDATTDGDHITKEHTRVKVISGHGYNPVRVMFYYPQRSQAIKIQETLKTLYAGIGGEYYAGDDAWDYIKKTSGYDLKNILIEIAEKRENKE